MPKYALKPDTKEYALLQAWFNYVRTHELYETARDWDLEHSDGHYPEDRERFDLMVERLDAGLPINYGPFGQYFYNLREFFTSGTCDWLVKMNPNMGETVEEFARRVSYRRCFTEMDYAEIDRDELIRLAKCPDPAVAAAARAVALDRSPVVVV